QAVTLERRIHSRDLVRAAIPVDLAERVPVADRWVLPVEAERRVAVALAPRVLGVELGAWRQGLGRELLPGCGVCHAAECGGCPPGVSRQRPVKVSAEGAAALGRRPRL